MKKTAILFGATGLVGGFVLKNLLNHGAYDKVIAFTRKPLNLQHPKLQNPIIDFDKLADYQHLIKGDDLYLCLGTTMKKAGSKDAFKKVDLDYPLQAAQLAKNNNVKQVMLCSAVDANAQSMIFYNQVKGTLEDALKRLNFEVTHIFQPSILMGERSENRLGERIGIAVSRVLDNVVGDNLGRYRPVSGQQVAQAMVMAAQKTQEGIHVYLSHEMVKGIGK